MAATLTTIGEEVLTVGNTSGGLSSDPSLSMPAATGVGTYDMPGVRMARFFVVSGSINYTLNGVVTTPTDGGDFELAVKNDRFEVWGEPDLMKFRAIRNGGVDATLLVSYEGTVEPTRPI